MGSCSKGSLAGLTIVEECDVVVRSLTFALCHFEAHHLLLNDMNGQVWLPKLCEDELVEGICERFVVSFLAAVSTAVPISNQKLVSPTNNMSSYM